MVDYRERLKNLRVDNDLEQKDVAEICGVSNKIVSHWETLRNEIPVECIVKLCVHYNVSADYVLGLTNEKSPYVKRLDYCESTLR